MHPGRHEGTSFHPGPSASTHVERSLYMHTPKHILSYYRLLSLCFSFLLLLCYILWILRETNMQGGVTDRPEVHFMVESYKILGLNEEHLIQQNCKPKSGSPGNCDCRRPTPRVSDTAALAWSPRRCIYNKSPDIWAPLCSSLASVHLIIPSPLL